MIRATATFRPRGDLGRFVDAKITPAVRQSVEEACRMIQERAQALCPVDTGALRASITVEVEDLPKTVRGNVGPHEDYAAHVEFGTGKMKAQPYMRPAFDEVRPKVLDVFKGHIGAAIEL